MAPQTDPTPGGDGFSQYVSCNSDECEVTNDSTPRAPVCICWVHDDRQNSHQPQEQIDQACNARGPDGPDGRPSGFLPCRGVDGKFCKDAPQCNCTHGAVGTDATALPPASAMATHVGRSHVFVASMLVGDFLSFPKAGACADGQLLGEGGCVWARQPRARILYGADLLAAGYNVSSGFNRNEIAFGLSQMDAFGRAAEALDLIVQPRCCGC